MSDQSSYMGSESLPAAPPTSDEKTLALVAHLITMVSAFIGPLVIYLLKKDDSPFVSSHAKESLNFQITVAIIVFVLFITVIGIFLLWLVALATVVLVIIATIKASEGKLYRYPFTLRLIK